MFTQYFSLSILFSIFIKHKIKISEIVLKCLTCFILPQTFNTDDVWLQVWLRWLHINKLSHVVCVVFKAAVLSVLSLGLWLQLPRLLWQILGFFTLFR